MPVITDRRAFVALAVAGIALRLYVGTLGWTQDLDYWHHFVAASQTTNIMDPAFGVGTVNHFPVVGRYSWLVLNALAGGGNAAEISPVLAAIDVAIGACLWQWGGLLAAALFLLNPIAIIISGYQRVDNLPILVGCIGAGLVDRRPGSGALLIGLSLTLKPILFLFPLWLMLQPRPWSERLVVLLIPYTLLAAAVLPWPGLLTAILSYHSSNNAPFWGMFDVGHISNWLTYSQLFGGALLLCGLRSCRERSSLEVFCVYCICTVIFAPALCNHYLAIPLIGLALGWNRWAAAYTALGGLFELSSPEGLHLRWMQWFPVAGDSEWALPVYRALIVLLMLHLATRQEVVA